MNKWIIYALLAPALYALVVFIDKYVVSKHVKDYRCMPIYAGIMGFVGGTLIWLLTGRPLLNPFDTFIALTTGFLTTIAFVAYYKALSKEEPSKINIFFQLSPVFVLLLSWLILGEKITLQQLIGFALIVVAALSVSVERNKKTKNKFFISKGLLYIVFYNILFAVSAVLIKLTLNFNTLATILSYPSWGAGLGALVLYIFSSGIRTSFHESISSINKKALLIMLSNEAIFIFARAITYLAYSLGLVALVSALEGAQVFYGIGYGWIVTIIAPGIILEDISKKNIITKLLAAIILVFGIWLISAV